MSFERPLVLLTLLAIPLAVGVYLLAERRRMRYAIRFTNLDVLAGVMGGRLWRRYVPPVLFLLALAALCVGVARPQRTTLVPRDRATVILVVDVSRSMEAKDVKPTRIGAAQQALRTFLKHVPSRLQIGLIAFAGEPAVAVPPTADHQLVREALDTIRWFPSFGGTAIGDALAEAVRLGQQAVSGQSGNLASVTAAGPVVPKGLVSILFLSDGRRPGGSSSRFREPSVRGPRASPSTRSPSARRTARSTSGSGPRPEASRAARAGACRFRRIQRPCARSPTAPAGSSSPRAPRSLCSLRTRSSARALAESPDDPRSRTPSCWALRPCWSRPVSSLPSGPRASRSQPRHYRLTPALRAAATKRIVPRARRSLTSVATLDVCPFALTFAT